MVGAVTTSSTESYALHLILAIFQKAKVGRISLGALQQILLSLHDCQLAEVLGVSMENLTNFVEYWVLSINRPPCQSSSATV